MKKGFSIIAMFIIILVLAGLGFGGYYAYNNYIAPMLNPNNAFIPENLKAFAKGSDADIFVIFNDKEEKISTLLKLAGIPEENNIAMKSGLVIVKNSTQCAAAVFEFDSNEKAANVKTLIENNVSKNSIPTFNYKIEQKDTILTIDVNEGFKGLSGNLTDNPLFKNLDLTHLEDQLIIAVNNRNIPEMFSELNSFTNPSNTINLSSFIPVANAQLIQAGDVPTDIAAAGAPETSEGKYPLAVLLYTVENSFIYAKIDALDISLAMKLKLMDKTTFEGSEIFKSIPGADSEEFYKQVDEAFNTVLNEQFKNMKVQMASFEASSEYKNLTVTLNVKFNIKDVITMLFSSIPSALNAPARGRDAARLGNLSSFVAAAEAYNSEKGKYPDKSGCFKDIKMNEYFSGGKTPKDPSGNQTFGDIVCEDGYYYQFLGQDNFVLWAKMEEKSNNNINLTPTEVEELVTDGKMPETENKCRTSDCGTYYIVNKINMLVPTDTTFTTKVKRKTTTGTDTTTTEEI